MMRLVILLFLLFTGLFASFAPVIAQPPPHANPTQIKSDLDSIFSRPEFRVETAQGDNVFTRAWKWLKEQWDAFWKRIGKSVGMSGGLPQWVLITAVWVFIILFVLLMGWLLAKLIQYFGYARAERKARKHTAFDFDEADADVIVEPDIWMQQAERFVQEGDYRRAFRAVFIAAILHLDRAGAINFDRARTNGDYIRQLRSGEFPDALRLFSPFVVEFDQRWYGDHLTNEADYRRCRETHASLLNAISAAARTDGKTPAPAGGRA